jgi:hypothetical protein
MAQMGFFDIENRYAALDAKNDPLVKINAAVPWEAFRSRLEQVWRKPADKRKSNAGCKPWDAIVMFKAIILCALYNLSDDQVEYQMRDRLSFVRFLGLTLEDKVPDAKTVWLYREQLSQAGLIDALFEDFDGYLKARATRRWVARSSMLRLSRFPFNAIVVTTMSRSNGVRHLRPGPTSQPSVDKRTGMRAGRRSTARATMATRITSPSTVGTS